MITAYEETFSFTSLMRAWREFRCGKKTKSDISEFEMRLTDNLIELQRDLAAGEYRHGGYTHFKISDPKPRDIHKASVRDRVVHHAVYRALYPYFDRKFIYDSYSCRNGKGTHRALNRLAQFIRREGKNNTRTVWVLKGDIVKCFASVHHTVLLQILESHIRCPRLFDVVRRIIDSFSFGEKRVGIPLGNLTSQLFINIYLNELDRFIKRDLKARRYIRYADDFIMLSHDKSMLLEYLPRVAAFLHERLALQLHPHKIILKTISSGIDFLGWVHFPDHRVLRTMTKRRMLSRLRQADVPAVRSSYQGLLSHGNTYQLAGALFWQSKGKDDTMAL